MQPISTLLLARCLRVALARLASAQAAPEMSSHQRLDSSTCAAPTGRQPAVLGHYAYGDLRLQLVFSCYLIKHGDEYMVWDAGHSHGRRPTWRPR